MELTVTLQRADHISFEFNGDRFEAFDSSEEEPVPIFGTITADGSEIGDMRLYALDNDADFYCRCAVLHEDCVAIARAICGRSGTVLKRYVPRETEYMPIYILDSISIRKEYRGKGIGSAVIKDLFGMMTYQFGDASTIFLCASDFESAKEYGFDSLEYREGTRRLIRFYERCGFRVVKDNIMMYHEPEIMSR